MALIKKKISARRKQVRETISAERYERISHILTGSTILSSLILLLFIGVSTVILSIDASDKMIRWKSNSEIISLAAIVTLVCLAAAFYIHHYQKRIITNYARSTALAGLYIILLVITKLGSFFPDWIYLATGSAVMSAIILTISYNQRFALGMSLFYSILACFAIGRVANIELFLTMMAGVIACCFSLKDIRTRMKLLEVSTIAAIAVLSTAIAMGFIQNFPIGTIFFNAGSAAAVTMAVGLVIQALLPIIEKAFRIATSMTLLDYSDANQPLLKKLAMEAPGTFSHCLLIGSIAESAAEAIGANGLLCRVGAYYHDIGKINKPSYFIENQMGGTSRHEQLSPAMSQLVIVGHVKDGVEMAREYGLPAVLRQFIETHHGTTLIEYFYNEAKKKQDGKQGPPMETEFRYPGPKPHTKEAAIVMLADAVEGAVRSLAEKTAPKIETVVHNLALKRLQDGQFDDCELTLRELSQIETSLSKSMAAHYHGRIAYPGTEEPVEQKEPEPEKTG
jgi:putative nucleotidyltransferase with HDIG domain